GPEPEKTVCAFARRVSRRTQDSGAPVSGSGAVEQSLAAGDHGNGGARSSEASHAIRCGHPDLAVTQHRRDIRGELFGRPGFFSRPMSSGPGGKDTRGVKLVIVGHRTHRNYKCWKPDDRKFGKRVRPRARDHEVGP